MCPHCASLGAASPRILLLSHLRFALYHEEADSHRHGPCRLRGAVGVGGWGHREADCSSLSFSAFPAAPSTLWLLIGSPHIQLPSGDPLSRALGKLLLPLSPQCRWEGFLLLLSPGLSCSPGWSGHETPSRACAVGSNLRYLFHIFSLRLLLHTPKQH